MQEIETKIREAAITIASRDTKIAVLIDQFGPLSVRPQNDPFSTLSKTIIGQQLSNSAAQAIQARVQDLFPYKNIDIRYIDDVQDTALRNAGLSTQKIGFIRGLASHISNGEIDFHLLESMGDREAINSLTEIKGIGRWTAEMYLISLNRMDILPLDDAALRASIKMVYDVNLSNFTAEAEAIAEKWRPYRSIACRYLYLHLDQSRIKEA
jgi:DNA-3-methyladenine glycosylase II